MSTRMKLPVFAAPIRDHPDVNIDMTALECKQIRALDDFDLRMLLSEIHGYGWPVARQTLKMAVQANAAVKARSL